MLDAVAKGEAATALKTADDMQARSLSFDLRSANSLRCSSR